LENPQFGMSDHGCSSSSGFGSQGFGLLMRAEDLVSEA
jgi:hypothetical protein